MYRKSYILRKKKGSSNVQIATALHKDVAERLSHINPPLASRARVVLDINKAERHIRGGMATKEKYEHEHQLRACSRDEE